MAYKVIHFFTDLQDNGHAYNVGDAFPREGASASDSRLAELSGADNLQHTPLIEKVKEETAEESSVVEKPEVKAVAAEKPKARKKRETKKE